MAVFEKVAVLGFGTMGAGIAHVLAATGRTVIMFEPTTKRLEEGRASLADFLDEGVRLGKTSEVDRAAMLDRITSTNHLDELAGADLVIEAVPEDFDVKSHALADAAAVAGPDAVLTSNTSALSISQLAAGVDHPERVAGLHFFNPAPLMGVVEVVRGLRTKDDVVKRLVEFVGDLGKDAVVVKDRPGFLINGLLMRYLNDVVQAYDDELATAEDIDTAIKLGLGYKMGPLELLDLIGLDVYERVTRSAYEATLDPGYAPPPLLQTMVAAGMRGNNNGEGFRTGGQA